MPEQGKAVLDTVVLSHDLPAHGLRAGDLGTVVEVYEPDGLEVEFVAPSGQTLALLTLNKDDVRPARDADAWDRQIEADARAGRLDEPAERALDAHRRGESRKL
jgi:hypothetical protein